MRRPKSPRSCSPDEIKAEIAEEESQLALLGRSLSDALLAGEETTSYHGAIDKTNRHIAELRVALNESDRIEGERRRNMAAVNAREIIAESHRRHATFIAAFFPPPSPSSLSEYSK